MWKINYPIRRKINLYIFITLIVSNIVFACFLWLYNIQQLETQISKEKEHLAIHIEERYSDLNNAINIIERHLKSTYQLPFTQVGDSLFKHYNGLNNIPLDQLRKSAKNINLDHLFIINKSGEIINGTLEKEIGYKLKKEGSEFMKSFDALFSTNSFKLQSLASSSVDNSVMFYLYYAPKNSNYVIEGSILFNRFLNERYGLGIKDLPFLGKKEKLFAGSNVIEDLEVFNITDGSKVSLLSASKLKLDDNDINTVITKGFLQFDSPNGQEYYKLVSVNKKNSEFKVNLLLYAKFNYTAFNKAYWQLVKLHAIIFFTILLFISVISILLINRYFISKVKIINHNLEAIKSANYQILKSFKSSDELSIISNNIIDVKNNVMERELQLTEALKKAMESDKLKSSFLANISHEIRTPMNSILGLSSLISDENLSDSERNYMLDIISKSTNSLLELLNNILDLSIIQADQMKLLNKEIDLVKLMEDLKTSFLVEIQAKNLFLKLDLTPLPDKYIINADYFRLHQVITNLITNAIKFTNSGGIEFGVKEIEPVLTLYVKDTGIGIPSSFGASVFDRFTKMEDNKNILYGGAGLGLAISKSLVELWQGKIWFESKENMGSTFFFTIPNTNLDNTEKTT